MASSSLDVYLTIKNAMNETADSVLTVFNILLSSALKLMKYKSLLCEKMLDSEIVLMVLSSVLSILQLRYILVSMVNLKNGNSSIYIDNDISLYMIMTVELCLNRHQCAEYDYVHVKYADRLKCGSGDDAILKGEETGFQDSYVICCLYHVTADLKLEHLCEKVLSDLGEELGCQAVPQVHVVGLIHREDLDVLSVRLAEPVDSSVRLLDQGHVDRQFKVDHAVAHLLDIQARGGGLVGGDQDVNALVWVVGVVDRVVAGRRGVGGPDATDVKADHKHDDALAGVLGLVAVPHQVLQLGRQAGQPRHHRPAVLVGGEEGVGLELVE